jgi:hypothetical protein
MIVEEEVSIFIKELGYLLEEYRTCQDDGIKAEIYKDIVLLGSVICPPHDKNKTAFAV